MEEEFRLLFTKQGFLQMETGMIECQLFYRQQGSYVNCVLMVRDGSRLLSMEEMIVLWKRNVQNHFGSQGYGIYRLLTILVGEDFSKLRPFVLADPFCWVIDRKNHALILYEEQEPDFCGIRKPIEELLAKMAYSGQENFHQKKVIVNYILIGLNILVFLITTFVWTSLFDLGLVSAPTVLGQHQYYRLLTSMFLHAGINHLYSNMLILLFLGGIVERKVGHLNYLVLYLVAGLLGGALSIWYQYHIFSEIGSVGASGAIFGVLGGLLFLILKNGSLEGMTVKNVIIGVVFSLVSGLMATNVDNAAHIGGLLTGFVLMFCWTITKKYKIISK